MEIKSLEGKVYEVIDLEEGVDVQVERVLALSRRATAFIFYARSDARIAETLGQRCARKTSPHS